MAQKLLYPIFEPCLSFVLSELLLQSESGSHESMDSGK